MKYQLQNNRLDIFIDARFLRKPLSSFFEEYCISKSTRYRYMMENRILIQNIPVRQDTRVFQKEDVLTILLPEEDIDWSPSETPCTVIYENAFVFVVHKEAGIPIHTEKQDTHCLNAQVARWAMDKGYHFPIRPVHRLDVDTTGLLLYSKIPFFQPWLDQQLASKKISRKYLAISNGSPLKPHTVFTCNDSIGKDRHRSNVYRVSPTGKTASTTVEALTYKNGFQLLQCTLLTGRTHQIRVHLSHHEYPIVNDPLYGHPSKHFLKMGLWANEITFKDPLTNKKHRIQDIPNKDYSFFE